MMFVFTLGDVISVIVVCVISVIWVAVCIAEWWGKFRSKSGDAKDDQEHKAQQAKGGAA